MHAPEDVTRLCAAVSLSVQNLAQQNPELHQLINQNPEDFMRLIQEPAAAGGGGGGGGGGGLPPGATQIQVTPAEREAIQRVIGSALAEPLSEPSPNAHAQARTHTRMRRDARRCDAMRCKHMPACKT
jgi:hypothetical protein